VEIKKTLAIKVYLTTRPNPIEWHLEKRKIKDLKPHPKNPRKLSKHDGDNLQKSIDEDGLIDKPAIDLSNQIIGGHQRLQILKKMGQKEVEVWVPNRELQDFEVNRINLRLNRVSGEWDYDILANEWTEEELITGGFTREELDFADPDQIDAKDDNFEVDTTKEPLTVLGDVYDLGDHRVCCGSADSHGDLLKLLGSELIDLVVTDPPYNVDLSGKSDFNSKKFSNRPIENDDLSDQEFEALLLNFYRNAYVFMKEGASIYVFHDDSEGEKFRRYFRESGLKLAQCLVWLKNSMVLGRHDYHWQHETILFGGKEWDNHDPVLYGWKEGEKHKWHSNRKQTTILKFDRPTRNKEHPTMKPIPLIGYILKNSSVRGELICDFFLGSGTTLIACEQLARRCFGTELDPAYCDVIVRRWVRSRQEANKDATVLRNGQPCKDFETPRE